MEGGDFQKFFGREGGEALSPCELMRDDLILTHEVSRRHFDRPSSRRAPSTYFFYLAPLASSRSRALMLHGLRIPLGPLRGHGPSGTRVSDVYALPPAPLPPIFHTLGLSPPGVLQPSFHFFIDHLFTSPVLTSLLGPSTDLPPRPKSPPTLRASAHLLLPPYFSP